METIDQSIVVNAPLRTVFEQWTRFSDFPEFMEGVYEVTQVSERHLHWRADIGGREKQWDAEITEWLPDQRLSWRSISGTRNGGTVSFLPLGAERTRVDLRMEYEPEGALENLEDAFGVLSRQVEGDLERFKQYLEGREREGASWRERLAAEPAGMETEPRSKRFRGGE